MSLIAIFCSVAADFWTTSTKLACFRPNLANFGSISADVWPTSTMFGRSRPKLARTRSISDDVRPNLDWSWPSCDVVGGTWANLANHQQIWTMSAVLGPNQILGPEQGWEHHGSCLRGGHRCHLDHLRRGAPTLPQRRPSHVSLRLADVRARMPVAEAVDHAEAAFELGPRLRRSRRRLGAGGWAVLVGVTHSFAVHSWSPFFGWGHCC